MYMMWLGKWFLALSLILSSLVAVVVIKGELEKPFDASILERRYDHSQWRIPLSTRIISDDQLYVVSGLRIVRGESLLQSSPEVPPLGKWLYGFAALSLRQPLWISIFVTVLGIGIWSLLLRQMGIKNWSWLIGLSWAVSSPLWTGQAIQTMMDSIQVSLVLLHLSMLWFSDETLPHPKNRQTIQKTAIWIIIFMSGFFLGLAAATKFFVFLLPFAAADFWWLITTTKRPLKLRLLSLLVFTLGGGLGYVLPYAPFILHESLLGWMKLQWWMLSFYRSSQQVHGWGMAVITHATGWYRAWWAGAPWNFQSAWNPLWMSSLLGLAGSVLLIMRRRKITRKQLWLTLAMGGLWVLLLSAPFWPRYALLTLPFGLLLLLSFMQNMPKRLLFSGAALFSFLLSLHSLSWFLPPPTESLQFLSSQWAQGNYEDAASFISVAQTQPDLFFKHIQEFETAMESTQSALLVTPERVAFPWSNTTPVVISWSLDTPLGPMKSTSTSTLHRQGHWWRLDWPTEWQGDFEPDNESKITVTTTPDAVLRSSDGIILAETKTEPWLFLVPDLMNPGIEQLNQASQDTNIGAVQIERTLFVNTIGDTAQKIGPLDTPEKVTYWKKQPGAIIRELPVRRYHQNLTESGKQILVQWEREHTNVLGIPAISYTQTIEGKDQVLRSQTGQAGVNQRLPFKAQELLSNPPPRAP